jgi:hypothetical protein
MKDAIEIAWKFGVMVILMLTLPIWFIPYTAYRAWIFNQHKLEKRKT